MLTCKDGSKEVIDFIARSNRGIHAEKALLSQLRNALQTKNKDKVSELSLVFMSSYSQCSQCREDILNFIREWQDKKVLLTYRIARLYHEEKENGDKKAINALQVWAAQLKGYALQYSLEPIRVMKEMLSDAENGREKYDDKIEAQVAKINEYTQQQIPLLPRTPMAHRN